MLGEFPVVMQLIKDVPEAEAAKHQGIEEVSADGSERISGHSLRVSGARGLATWASTRTRYSCWAGGAQTLSEPTSATDTQPSLSAGRLHDRRRSKALRPWT